jgi:hypothetical protein
MNPGRNANTNDGRAIDVAAAAPAAAVLPRRSTAYMFTIQADGTLLPHFGNPRPNSGLVQVSHLQEEAVQQWGDRYNRLPPGERASRATYERSMAELEQILQGAPRVAPAANPNGLDAKMAWWVVRLHHASDGSFPLRVDEIAELTGLAIGALSNDSLYLKLEAPLAIGKDNLHGDLPYLRRVIAEGGASYVHAQCVREDANSDQT